MDKKRDVLKNLGLEDRDGPTPDLLVLALCVCHAVQHMLREGIAVCKTCVNNVYVQILHQIGDCTPLPRLPSPGLMRNILVMMRTNSAKDG